MAWARKLDGARGRVYALLGDGEAAEGSVWEAAQFASHYKLDNLVAIVDVNRWARAARRCTATTRASTSALRARSGWAAASVDGHDVDDAAPGLRAAARRAGSPSR
jgi:transketolase